MTSFCYVACVAFGGNPALAHGLATYWCNRPTAGAYSVCPVWVWLSARRQTLAMLLSLPENSACPPACACRMWPRAAGMHSWVEHVRQPDGSVGQRPVAGSGSRYGAWKGYLEQAGGQ